MNDLFELPDLKNILGFIDIRTIRTWCRKNNVPIIVLGRKSYVPRQSIDTIIERQLPGCGRIKDDHQSASDAIRWHDVPLLGQPIKSEVGVSKHIEIKRSKKMHSKAAIALLNAVDLAK